MPDLRQAERAALSAVLQCPVRGYRSWALACRDLSLAGISGGGEQRASGGQRGGLIAEAGLGYAPSRLPLTEAQVAQSVEQRTENPRVGGSIPPLGTIFPAFQTTVLSVGERLNWPPFRVSGRQKWRA